MRSVPHQDHLALPGRAGMLAAVGRNPGCSVKRLAKQIGCPEAWTYQQLRALRRAGLLTTLKNHGAEDPIYRLDPSGRRALSVYADTTGRPETEDQMRRIATGLPYRKDIRA